MSQSVLAQLLLIEDHGDTAYVLARMLQLYGFVVRHAATASDAIAAVEHHPFDAIVSDIGLPDMDGCDLLPKLRQYTSAPAVVVSAFARETDIQRCLDAGFAAHVVKPMNIKVLVDTISALIWPSQQNI
jgi:CheY-like chemotaxis protein